VADVALRKPVLIIVRDGWGVREEREGNATKIAETPRHDALLERFPAALVNASEHWVGLPGGQMGNSEVGHLNMGAGRVVYQDFGRVEHAIEEGELGRNPALLQAMHRAEERDRALHLIGLCSDGGVHSHQRHVRALLEMARDAGVERVYLHAITDGRDTDPHSGREHLRTIQGWLDEVGLGRIATVSGRYYAMDRDQRWERVQKAYEAIVYGEGPRARDPVEAVAESYAAGVTDEFVVPTVIAEGGQPVGPLRRGDQVIAFNFRADRMRQVCRALTDPDFDAFPRRNRNVYELVSMTEYEKGLPVRGVAFPPQQVPRHLSAVVSELGLTQFKCAETEKYAHVTFFWNGGVEAPLQGEERTLLPSPRVATYDLQPEMCAEAVTEAVEARLRDADDALVVVNFANPDMVGHTGDLEAAVAAVETVDACVGRLVDAMLRKGGAAIITADHGNCEQMIDPETGRPHTAHTTCPVHAIVCDEDVVGRRGRTDASLADIAPTALELMGLEQPPEMTGRSVLAPA